MHLPRPVSHKVTKKIMTTTVNPVTSTLHPVNQNLETGTILTLATSSKTREAIEALLMLGNIPSTDNSQTHEDDNALLVPITGAVKGSKAPMVVELPDPPDFLAEHMDDEATKELEEPAVKLSRDETNNENSARAEPTEWSGAPLSGTVLGVAVKTDFAEVDCDDNKPITVPVKKELSFKQYGIKCKYKLACKFKCNLCPMELLSVHEYNKHYLEKHPPLPCLDCTKVFMSPRTLAKHCYTHAEFMFECQDCGCGFIFKSKLESHHKVLSRNAVAVLKENLS